MAYVLKDTQETALSVTVLDKRGNPATVQNPGFTSSDPAIVAVADGGLTAVASAAGPLGTATVTFTGDADLGDGVSPIKGVLDVQVVGGDAAVTNIVAAPPTEQPAAAPAPTPAPAPAPAPGPDPTPAPTP